MISFEAPAGDPSPAALAPRSDFPILDELTYLNAASIGLVPMPVRAAAAAFDREIMARGTTWFDERQETEVLDRARLAGARLLDVDPETIAVPSSATQVLCEVAWALRPGARENVVSADIEFPSATYPWMRVAEDTGAEVRLVRALDDPASLDVDAIAAAVDGRTAAICVSHVQYATGAVLDLAALGALARAHGAALVVDATQSAGMVPIDLARTPADVVVAGGYKRLCGPFGAAIAYLSPAILERLRPSFVGWRSTVDPYALDARTMPLAASARKLEFSTMSYSAGYALGAAIEYVLDVGVERILDHGRALGDRLIAGLDDLGVEVVTPRDAALRAGTVTARFGARDGEAVAGELNARGVIVSPRFGSTRFSLAFFNDATDVDRALAVLQDVLGDTRS